MRRVVVTGLGLIAPTGNCVEDAWNSALAGRSAVTEISLFDASDLAVRIAAEVKNFDVSAVMDAKEARQSSRFVQFAAAAAQQALDGSGLNLAGESAPRRGCIVGVGMGAFGLIEQGAHTLKERGAKRVSPHLVPYTIPNMAAGYIAMRHGMEGPNFAVSTACASGTHAIGEAFLRVALGAADVMVAGGAEATITPLAIAAFAQMRALSTRNDAPAQASRPFDLERDGFVMGEGCGLLVLEEYEHARARGARIYAELVGYGMSADAYHITSPPPGGDGIARAMREAIDGARIPLDQVDYINAHGTSTGANDAAESAAIESVFGPSAAHLAVSSTKGVTGHCLGAAGGIEAVYTVLAVDRAIIPPTANYTTPDPACPLDYVPGAARQQAIRYALSNSCGFGGQNACLAFRKM